MLRALLSLLIVGVVATTPSRSGAGPAPVAFRVIVDPRNPVDSIEHKFLFEAFLRKTTKWPDGQAIHPVDQPTDSPTRRRFSDDALNRSVNAVKEYWLQAIFSGRGVPPPEVDNDEQVVKFVLRTPGAIGYVSGSANLGGAKAVTVR